ncbi:MAG TPA: glycosyltransferase [Bryobacteraceae bacterium]|jgi:glycosyltransferase involved in cell wall biosynthesis|nr:glycosyltransferase [Bryobacteraceae bacterium]
MIDRVQADCSLERVRASPSLDVNRESGLRVLHVVYTLDPGGAGSVEAARLYARLSGSACSIEVLSLDDDVTPFLTHWPVPVHCAGKAISSYRYVPALVEWLRRNARRFDAVVVHGIWHYHLPAVWRALRSGPIPYFVILHGMLNPWFKHTYRLKHFKKTVFWKAGVRRAIEGASGVLFLCEEESLLAQETFKFKPRKQAVVPLGVRVEQAPPTLFLDRFPELRSRRLILFLGRICFMKGCDLLLDAFANIESEHSDAHLVMCGPDGEQWQKQLIRRAKELRISHRVTWTGPLYSEMKWSALRAADLLALPSRCETFPITVLEALSCGLPVLISEDVNICQVVRDGGAGFVCLPTVSSVEQAMGRWLAMNHSERPAWRLRANECFAQNYELEGAFRKHVDALRACMTATGGLLVGN